MEQFQKLGPREFLTVANELKYRFRCDEFHEPELIAACSLVRSAVDRQLGLVLHDEQLLAGIALFDERFVEMATGEGKTLAAILPLFLRSLSGKGAWLATANDYLADRDAEWTRPVFEMLGVTVASIGSTTPLAERTVNYQADVVYCTISELGFDFMRDRRATRDHPDRPTLQPPFHSLLVDEVDCLLIDDATTPLIISRSRSENGKAKLFEWAASIVERFEVESHFQWDELRNLPDLTCAGMHLVRKLSPGSSNESQNLNERYEYVERAIQVASIFEREKDYSVLDGRLQLIDKATGRIYSQRQFGKGIHQALEAKENIAISAKSEKSAEISVQSLVQKFKFLSGMSGTIGRSAREMQLVFKRRSATIPTHRPLQRDILSPIVVDSQDDKRKAIADEIKLMQNCGRAVLVGTASVKTSEQLSSALTDRGIGHQLLNANNCHLEAKLIACAGQKNQVTIATEIAGRGTDIVLHDDVRSAGGLHVVVAELHQSKRIDDQLIGRCGRQGDPASARIIVSKDDKLLADAFGESVAARWLTQCKEKSDRWWMSKFERAQRRLESRNLLARRQLLFFEQQKLKKQRIAGLDPILDNFDE